MVISTIRPLCVSNPFLAEPRTSGLPGRPVEIGTAPAPPASPALEAAPRLPAWPPQRLCRKHLPWELVDLTWLHPPFRVFPFLQRLLAHWPTLRPLSLSSSQSSRCIRTGRMEGGGRAAGPGLACALPARLGRQHHSNHEAPWLEKAKSEASQAPPSAAPETLPCGPRTPRG